MPLTCYTILPASLFIGQAKTKRYVWFNAPLAPGQNDEQRDTKKSKKWRNRIIDPAIKTAQSDEGAEQHLKKLCCRSNINIVKVAIFADQLFILGARPAIIVQAFQFTGRRFVENHHGVFMHL